jgi:hypothetical protein
MEDLVQWSTGFGLHGYGQYFDTYEKVGESWFIRSTQPTEHEVLSAFA